MSEQIPNISMEEALEEILEFPLASLPRELQRLLTCIQRMTGFGIEGAALMAFGILSGCAGKRYCVSGAFGNELTFLNIYLVIGRASGECKSLLKRRLMKIFDELHRGFLIEQEQLRSELLIEKTRLQKQANKPNPPPGAASRLAEIERELSKVRQWDSTNSTPEALLGRLGMNDGELFFHSSDAGDAIEILCGRYGSDKGNPWAILLGAFSGDNESKDRVGSTSIRVDNPHLAMLLMAQPVVVEKFVGLGRARGLSGRTLIFQDEGPETDNDEFDSSFEGIDWWDGLCAHILKQRSRPKAEIKKIQCTEDPKQVFKEFHAEAKQVARDKKLTYGETSRWRELAIKVAGLMMIMKHGPHGGPIPPLTDDVAEVACQVIRFFGHHNLQLLEEKTKADCLEAKEKLMKKFFAILEGGGGKMSRGEMQVKGFRKSDFLRADPYLDDYSDRLRVTRQGKGVTYELISGSAPPVADNTEEPEITVYPV